MTTPFPHDGSGFLMDEQSRVLMLDDALATGDAAYLVHAFAVVARSLGMDELARASGFDRARLYKALSDPAHLDLDTLVRIMSALRLRLGCSGQTDDAD
jgi:probable addiction module antidote protein